VRRPHIDPDLGRSCQYGYRDVARRVVVHHHDTATPTAGRRVLTPETRAELRDRFVLEYRAGGTLTGIADVHGWSVSFVRTLLHEACVPMRPKGFRGLPRGWAVKSDV
jgi:hypothetical protein